MPELYWTLFTVWSEILFTVLQLSKFGCSFAFVLLQWKISVTPDDQLNEMNSYKFDVQNVLRLITIPTTNAGSTQTVKCASSIPINQLKTVIMQTPKRRGPAPLTGPLSIPEMIQE
jgi:hypothetical protein